MSREDPGSQLTEPRQRKLGIRLWIMLRDQINLRRVLPPRKVAPFAFLHHPRFEPFLERAQDAGVGHAMLHELDQPTFVEVITESLAVSAQDSGPSGSLVLSRKNFAFSASCRLIPVHKYRVITQ